MTLLPDTTNISPSEAAARRRELMRQIIEILASTPRPYNIGIGREIKQARPDLPVKHINFALSCITRDRRYLAATVEADHRHSLDGRTSELTEKHKRYAIEKLKPRKKPVAHSKSDSGLIASPVTTPVAQQKPAQPASAKRYSKTLSLKRGAV